MASHSGTLYVGVTNTIERRAYEHKRSLVEGFSKTYGCPRLVYVECHGDIREAIARKSKSKNGDEKEGIFD